MKSPTQGEILTNADYHRGTEWGDLISSSRFRLFYRSPAAYRYPIPFDGNEATDGGTANHTCILEPEKLSELLVLPEYTFNSSAGKDLWRSWLSAQGVEDVDGLALKDDIIAAARAMAERNGKSIVSAEQLETARAIARSVHEHPQAVELLAYTLKERSFRAGGRKCRPDAMGDGDLIDVKTCARFDSFEYIARDMGYLKQMAWYHKVLSDCEVPVLAWVWIVVDPKPFRQAQDGIPRHSVRVWYASERAVEEAMGELDYALERFEECQACGDWPDTILEMKEIRGLNNE